MFESGKILSEISKVAIEVATVKANTENHNGELQEFKKIFSKHEEKEEQQYKDQDKKIDNLKKYIGGLSCPYDKRIITLEQNEVKIRDAKILEDKEKAKEDKKIVQRVAKLETRSKYNLLSMSGLWTTLGVILKKLFSS